MNTVIVASTASHAGKSGLCLALIGLLHERGVRVGYFKPYGAMPVTADGVLTDQDAVYIGSVTPVKVALDVVGPVVESRALVEDVFENDPGDMLDPVRAAFKTVSATADAMVVEGPSDLAQGRTLGLNLCALAEALDAQVLLVDTPSHIDFPDRVLWAGDCLGERLLGVVFNAIAPQLYDFVSDDVTRFLRNRGVRVYGTIAHDPMLSSVSVEEVVDGLAGTVLCAEEHLQERVQSFMVGAMGQDKALRFFRRKARKAVITGGDRSDVQLAALETDTCCIVLTGNLPPSSLVLARAEELGVPMILVGMDTLTAVERMETLLGRVRIHDPGKAARIREMLTDACDVDALLSDAYGV